MNDNNSNNVIKDDSIINNDSNGQVTNNDAISDEQDISDNNIGNGYNSLASSNREAFTRGLNENYADRIARNKANLAQARARSNEAQKKGNDDELKDKNILDKAQDKANVLKNNASLLSSQIDSARSKAYQMMHPVEAAKIVAKRKLQKWAIGILISSLPMLLSIFVVFIACFYVLDLFGTASATGNSSGIVYESEYNYEETMVTVMDASNTNVLANVSLEDYVIGVVCPEIGACGGNVTNTESSEYVEEHYVKTLMVVARTYGLARGKYNNTSKSITIKASTSDQQWCDLETGCIVTEGDDYSNTYPGDYDGEIEGEITETYTYTEEDLSRLRQYYSETYGELYLSNSHNDTISSLSWEDEPEYKASTQRYWEEEAKAGKTYVEILNGMADSGVTDSEDYADRSIYELGDYCEISYIGNTGTLVELEEYPDVGSTTKINKPITQILSSEEIENLNNYIMSSVDKAGYGTGEAVAAAGQSLIYGLYQYGYHLPYWYGGGHGKGITIGVDTNWGKKGKTFDYSWYSWNIARNRNTYSYDCSGFVSWSVKNACKSNFSPLVGSSFLNFGSAINLKDAKPGDMMVLPGEHIMLVVKNNGNDGVIVAESTPNKITFTSFKTAGKYVIVDMSNWYANNCNTSR